MRPYVKHIGYVLLFVVVVALVIMLIMALQYIGELEAQIAERDSLIKTLVYYGTQVV